MSDNLPQYISLSEYREKCFAGKPPCDDTLYKMINDGDLPGRKFGNKFFVDLTAANQQTGNALVDSVLNG